MSTIEEPSAALNLTGHPFYQAIARVWQEQGGAGSPPDAFIRRYFALIYNDALPREQDLSHQERFEQVLREWADVTLLTNAYQERASPFFSKLLQRCLDYVDLICDYCEYHFSEGGD